ncbi:MAG: LysR family transcriptional regulator [Spirochaetaceae bacterium]|jgi:molybdate transport system regulatory protein|nr:LysR family transcriptional regulator [Spirochaetaceae bacterium]
MSDEPLDPRSRPVKPVVKVFLVHPEEERSFCGPGMIRLLMAIEETGNVRRACEQMRMSYSKGWKLLSALEQWVGFPLTVRRQGGKGGGEAHLTDQGRAFLAWHQAFLKECQEAVDHIFATCHGGIVPDGPRP